MASDDEARSNHRRHRRLGSRATSFYGWWSPALLGTTNVQQPQAEEPAEPPLNDAQFGGGAAGATGGGEASA